MNEKGTPICECNACFTGPDCSQMVADCVADVASGDPLFLEPFWIANSEAGATVVPAWYRMSYLMNDAGNSVVSPALEKQIRAIHALAYRRQTEIFDSADNSWKGDAKAWIKRTKSLNSTTFIEFVTSPNNPDALLKEAVLEGENVKTIYDYAYYWPHFTAISHQAEEDIMLFTLSKLT
ncbi:hypothetical protein KI387_043550, partial [Taxus chinensis]